MGECFRDGSSESRVKDTANGIKGQIEASMSHKKLISHLRTLNCDIDIVINTSSSEHENSLLTYYDGVITKHVNENGYISLIDALRNSVNTCAPYLNNYDFLFVCRLDILLKDPLIELFDPSWDKITFPNVMYIDKGMNYPHIAGLFCFIPKHYFTPFDAWAGLMKNTEHLLGHHCVKYLLENGLTLHHIGFVTDKLYIANTIQMTNPLYAIKGRPEGPSYVKGYSELTYVKERHCIIDSSGSVVCSE